MMATQEADDEDRLLLEQLQPLKDLAKNFNIDVASFLASYLQEEGFSQEAFTQNGSELNFAKAALVLQNSSFVYSRKIDYLCSLVYRVWNELGVDQAQHRSSSAPNDIDQFWQIEKQDFLTLDDVLPSVAEGKVDRASSLEEGRRSSVGTATRHSTTMRPEDQWLLQADPTSHTPGGMALMGACVGASNAMIVPGSDITLDPQLMEQTGPLIVPVSDYDDGVDDDGPGFAMHDDDDDDMPMPSDDGPLIEEEAVHDQRARVTFSLPVTTNKAVEDPWAPLDPYEADDTKPKPLRRGNTLRPPRMNASVEKPTMGPWKDYSDVPLQGSFFGVEFKEGIDRIKKHRAAKRRQERATRAVEAYAPEVDDDDDDGYMPFDDGDDQDDWGNTGGGLPSLDDIVQSADAGTWTHALTVLGSLEENASHSLDVR